MRYLVLTDIHANLEALDACLKDAAGRDCRRTLVLGDLVGYGADPNAVIDRIIALKPTAIVRGNHDKVACGLDQAEGFNVVARRAAKWTLDELKPEHRRWLTELPQGPVVIDELIEICHGSPFDEDAYVFDLADAARALQTSSRPLCLFGHTHYPTVFCLADGVLEHLPGALETGELALHKGAKYLVNPGAVGQPRDGDPRACYAIADTEARRVELIRLAYDVETAQSKVIKAGLPDVLARRLASGR